MIVIRLLRWGPNGLELCYSALLASLLFYGQLGGLQVRVPLTAAAASVSMSG